MSQDWNADQYAQNARFVSDFGKEVVEWLAPKTGERVLDLGCGDGVLTQEIVNRGCHVVGVDQSPDMVRAALARGLDARLMSGEHLAFDQPFDAVFSNAALHWMSRDPGLVVENVARSLKPGGRFVGEFGGHGNVAAITVAIRAAMASAGYGCGDFSPWYFPTDFEYRELLERHGFLVERIQLMPRPTQLPSGMDAWLSTFAGPFFAQCPSASIPEIVEKAVELLRPSLRDRRGVWTADYVRLRFYASKP